MIAVQQYPSLPMNPAESLPAAQPMAGWGYLVMLAEHLLGHAETARPRSPPLSKPAALAAHALFDEPAPVLAASSDAAATAADMAYDYGFPPAAARDREQSVCSTSSTSTSSPRHSSSGGGSSGGRVFHCESCSKVFSCRSNLSRHRSVHSGVKRYGCQFCGLAFANSSNRRKHERMHCKYRHGHTDAEADVDSDRHRSPSPAERAFS